MIEAVPDEILLIGEETHETLGLRCFPLRLELGSFETLNGQADMNLR